MSDGKHFPWNEGQSTKPDVDALMKAFPVETLVIGARFTDEQLRAVLGRCEGDRYRTVYSAWIKRLQHDHGINMFREKMVGFYVPTFDQAAGRTHPALQHIQRTAKKQTKVIAVAKPENDSQRAVQDHQGRLLHSMQREAKKAKMNYLPPLNVSAPVQISPMVK